MIIGDQLGRIAGTPQLKGSNHRFSGDPFDSIDDGLHRITMTTAVVRTEGGAALYFGRKALECSYLLLFNIHNKRLFPRGSSFANILIYVLMVTARASSI